MSDISIMIVDNDPARAASLESSLQAQKELTVVASVTMREAALRQLSPPPQVMLLHTDTLTRNGLPRLLNTLRNQAMKTRVVLLCSAAPDDDQVIDSVRLGARGYILSSAQPALVVKAVRAVAAGGIWVERRILEKAISARKTLLPESLRPQVPQLRDLTDRERDMLNHVLKGATNREIAEMSNISERTVKTHLYRAYRKLNVKSRTKAIALLSQ